VKEEVAADFQFTGVSSGPHPMSFLRERLAAKGVLSAAQLAHVPGGHRARMAGIVIVRQRPGTAKGVVFLTLEDETGFANAIVSAAAFEHNRLLLIRAHALIVEGMVQSHEGVISLRADRFTLISDEETHVDVSHDFY
jgi:error-prone DNA polymerase